MSMMISVNVCSDEIDRICGDILYFCRKTTRENVQPLKRGEQEEINLKEKIPTPIL